IKVSGRNSVGCESQKTNISISQITATEPENLTTSFACGPENAVMLEVGGAPDGFTYNWYESAEAITPVQSSESDKFLTEPLSSSKSFYVTMVSPEGCESLRTLVMAEIFSINITASEDKLISSSDTGNQWFFNGNAIEGATDKEYAPEESGTYTLTVTRGTCTLEESVDFLVTSIGENEAGLLTLYPNPVTNVLNVIVSNELIDEGGSKMLILDNSGRIMLNSDIVSSETEVDLGSLSKGVYFIHISNKNQKIIRRIVKE
ncbi:MAG TPA: T9SS type A sorting domain-containing protein, partial [Cyclobacteriaceae bacterium]